LASSAGAEPIDTITAKRNAPDPAYFVGSGKADEIGACRQGPGRGTRHLQPRLSPAQQRNLERRLKCASSTVPA
jgi:GTP-binding protein HflX